MTAFVELFADDSKLYRALARGKAAVQSWGAGVRTAGYGALAVGAAIAAPFKVAVDQITELGKLADVAQALGITAEKATGLFAVFESSGSDTRDATEGLITLAQRVQDAVAGKGEEAVDLFRKLKVDAKEFAGLDPAEQFFKLHEALKGVKGESQQASLLLKAVGEDTGKNMLRTLSMTTEQLRAQVAAGAISAPDLATARAASQQLTAAGAAITQVFRAVAVAVAPTVKSVAEWLATAAGAARRWVQANQPLVVGALGLAAGVVAAGGALVGLGFGLSALGTVGGAALAVVKGLATGLLLVLSPVGLVAAALGAGVGLWLAFTDSGRQAWAAVKDGVGDFLATFQDTWAVVSDSLANGDFAGAGDVAFAGLSLAWAQAVTQMQTVWVNFTRFMRDAFAVSKDAIVSAWATAVDFLADRIARNFYDDAVAGQLSQIQAEEKKLRERNLLETVAANGTDADARLAALRGREDAARARFDETRQRAAEDALIAEWFRLLDQPAAAAARLPTPAAGLAGSVRGLFGGAAREGTFAFGEQRQAQQQTDLLKEQLGEQRKTNDLLAKTGLFAT